MTGINHHALEQPNGDRMKKIFIVVLLLSSSIANACESYVIGFRGLNGAFDLAAFNVYVGNKCSKLYNPTQTKEAINFIKKIDLPYELYGFSLGASSIKTVLKRVPVKPIFVLTIGAYHTADVNFDLYGVKYQNYFDNSGKRQKNIGIFVPNVEHMKLQEYVNNEIGGNYAMDRKRSR